MNDPRRSPEEGILADKNGKDAAAAILTLNLMVGSVPGSGGLIEPEMTVFSLTR